MPLMKKFPKLDDLMTPRSRRKIAPAPTEDGEEMLRSIFKSLATK